MIKFTGKEESHLARKKRDLELEKLQKEKELLELENLKLQKREKLVSIISTIVITVTAVITAVLKWLGIN